MNCGNCRKFNDTLFCSAGVSAKFDDPGCEDYVGREVVVDSKGMCGCVPTDCDCKKDHQTKGEIIEEWYHEDGEEKDRVLLSQKIDEALEQARLETIKNMREEYRSPDNLWETLKRVLTSVNID